MWRPERPIDCQAFGHTAALANGSRGEARRRRAPRHARQRREALLPPLRLLQPPPPQLPERALRPPEQLPRRSRSRMVRGARQPQQPRSRLAPRWGRSWVEVGVGDGLRARERAQGQRLGAVKHSGLRDGRGGGFRLRGDLGASTGEGVGWAAIASSRPDERGVWGKGRQGVRLGAPGPEGQGARAPWTGRGMRGARGLEGRGSEGQCTLGRGWARERGGRRGLRGWRGRQWVGGGGWFWGAGLWRIGAEDGARDQQGERGLGKADIRGTVSPRIAWSW